jgi:hypothetical protein
MAIGVTSRAIWQLVRKATPDAAAETALAEVFPGIGIYARPPSSANAEAIVFNVGGADHPIVIALRDEDTRRASADIDADETMIYTSQVVVYLKANGTIEARTVGGSALALATKDDIDALKSWAENHYHLSHGAVSIVPPPSANGTQKFKAE